jgi:hypothetical protein
MRRPRGEVSKAARKRSERCREAVLRGVVRGEFVASASQVLHERVAGRDRARRPYSGQSAHRAQPCCEPTMISFYDVIRVLLPDVSALDMSSSRTLGYTGARPVVTSSGVRPKAMAG